jgi:hypothetical protein
MHGVGPNTESARWHAHARAGRAHAVFGWCAWWVLAALVGCGGPGNPVTSPGVEGEDYVGKDEPVALASLRFRDAAERTRFDRVRGCFAARGAGEGWRHYPLRKLGNFVQEDWCRGERSKNCAGGSFRGERGDEWYEVFTLHYERDWPEVFSLGVGAGRLPREGEWGVSFSYTANGGTIVGPGFGVSFHRFEGEEIAWALHLGHAYVYEVEETRIEVRAPGSQDDELALLVRSPQSLRDTALARLSALSAEVERQISAGLVRKCVYGPYEGNGVPPVCAPTPLSAEDTAAALERARGELAARQAAVNQRSQEFHGLLVELMAFDRCW